MVNRNAILVAQQNYILLWSDDGVETIEFLLGVQYEIARGLPGVLYFFLCNDVRCGLNLGIEVMCGQTTLPGGRYFLDSRDQRALPENEFDASDGRRPIDRTLRTVFVCGSQPSPPRTD